MQEMARNPGETWPGSSKEQNHNDKDVADKVRQEMGKETLRQKVLEARAGDSRAEFRNREKQAETIGKANTGRVKATGKSHPFNVYIRVLKTGMCVLEYSHCPGNTAWLLSKWRSGWGHTSEQITLVCFVVSPGLPFCWLAASCRGYLLGPAVLTEGCPCSIHGALSPEAPVPLSG